MEELAGLLFIFVLLALPVTFFIVSFWIVFSKANQPGWTAIIPIVNLYILVKIAGKPGWWLILYFIPLVNIIITILVALGVAENFGKGPAFGLGLWIFPYIFYPILAFGTAEYQSREVFSQNNTADYIAGPPPENPVA